MTIPARMAEGFRALLPPVLGFLVILVAGGLLTWACESDRIRHLEADKKREQDECRALVTDAEREARYSDVLGCMVKTDRGWVPFNRYKWEP